MTRGLSELYREDPDEADRLLFGRVTHPDRRGFLKNAGLTAMAALVGGTIPFHRTMPAHFFPVALADESVIQEKGRPGRAQRPPAERGDAGAFAR